MEEKVNAQDFSNSVEEKKQAEDVKINEIVESIIGDKEEANKFNIAMEDLRRKVGLIPLESPKFKPKTMLEEVIYNMRWNPALFLECDIMKLHEYEMVLCAHIVFCKSRENRWLSAYEIEKKSFERAVASVSQYCSAKSVDERKSEAICRNKKLRERSRQLQIYKLYAEQCANISDAFVQMDNSLKKLIDTRRMEYNNDRKLP